MNPKYLVRPHDSLVFELDESNECYRPYSRKMDAYRPAAQSHFTFENLIENFGFFAIKEEELEKYREKNDEYNEYLHWTTRSDGHGGSKGGTYEEFLQTKKPKQNEFT